MKPLLSILLLATPFLVKAQYDNLKLENGQVYFEKVYSVDSSDAYSIERLLTMNVPKLKDVNDFNKTSDIITAKIKDALIDYKKYGGKWGNTAAFLNHPFFGEISIVWKDQKYRVTVSNMHFNTAGFGIMKCSDLVTKKRGTELETSKGMITAGQYIEKYLSDLFLIQKSSNEDW